MTSKVTGPLSGMAKRWGLALWAAVLCLASVAATAQLFGPLDLTGAELFERYCAACHGTEGIGDGPVAATLNRAVPDLTRISARADGEFPLVAVRAIIDGRSPVVAHGTRSMPVWGYEFWVEEGSDVVAEERANEMIDRLIEHLRRIQEPGPTAGRATRP